MKNPPDRIPAIGSPGQPAPRLSSAHLSLAEFIKYQAGFAFDEKDGWQRRLVVFPLVHGTCGEDGTLQGLLELAGVPYVGSDTLGSAVAMDKHIAKKLVASEGIPVVPWVLVSPFKWGRDSLACMDEAIGLLGFPLFVKPASLGSSVGIAKAHDKEGLERACRLAMRYDDRILIERAVVRPRELECATLGGEDPECAGPGEVIPGQEFYSYDDKYGSSSRAQIRIPADVSAGLARKARSRTAQIARILGLYGMARVDFLYQASEDRLYFNEANTIPGFTEISQYPMLWKHAGVSEQELISRLADLALERYALRSRFERDCLRGQDV